MKKTLLVLLLLITSINLFAQVDQKLIYTHIKYLASDSLKGRGTGSKEELLAANYIAKQFKLYNLKSFTPNYLKSFAFKRAKNPHDTSTTNLIEEKANNVVGFIDNNVENTIVIGAHYDHLGLGHDHNSLDANPENKIHNGADDNASGTAGVIELARYFSTNKKTEPYNFLFVCFSGEELGLLGSKKYVEDSDISLKKINYMLNMDMIGRLNDSTKKLLVYGVGTSSNWVKLLDETKSQFSIKKDSSGIGPSDQTSFYLKDIPVLHFFTGQHGDYHKPSDDVEKINIMGEVAVLNYMISLIEKTLLLPKFDFLKTRNPDTGKSIFKVTLGIMPDYAFDGEGLRIDGVTDNKPAFKAGILKGDVIIEMGNEKIKDVQDYMKQLSNYKKGDTCSLKVLRENKIIALQATF